MVGNDVVDLAVDASRELHPRFDTRVFAPSERDALRHSGSAGRLRWMLWAAKEAAYKVAKKRDLRTVFSPSRFVVTLGPSLRGEVCHGDLRIPVVLEASGEAVHAVAFGPGEAGERLVFAVEPREGEDPSRAARSAAVRALARCLGRPARDLRVCLRGRIPFLELRGEPEPLDLSLSHHGRFVAFACDPGRNPA